ncbi:membrane cofactor protein-like, partial [Podarcis muralis]
RRGFHVWLPPPRLPLGGASEATPLLTPLGRKSAPPPLPSRRVVSWARSVALLFSCGGSCGGAFSFSDSGLSLLYDGASSWRGAVSVSAAAAVFLAVQSSSFRTPSEFLFPSDCTHPHVANATLRSGDPKDSYPAGTVLPYRCIAGYESIPGDTLFLTCLDTSKWSIENPRFCQGSRCPTINLENGRIVKSSDMRLGDEITLGCNEGYRLIGEKTLRCVLVGDKLEWHTGPPFCHLIRCYPPENIPFGSHSGRPFEEFHYGSSVTYTCRQGFSLIGSPISTCSASADGTRGEWSPSPPKCKVVRCREPEIENGRVTTKPQRIYTYGDRADFECNPGYVMVGSSTCTCGPDHAWIPLFPKCFKAGTPGGGGDDNPGPGNGADPETVPPGDNTGPTHNPETPPGDDTGKALCWRYGKDNAYLKHKFVQCCIRTMLWEEVLDCITMTMQKKRKLLAKNILLNYIPILLNYIPIWKLTTRQ